MAVEEPAAERLTEIAGLLGCPVATFFQVDDMHDISMTHELLRLWNTIGDTQARQRLLAIVREEADFCASVPKAAE